MIARGGVVVRYVVPERITDPRQLGACREILSADELERMERLVRPSDRQRFVVAHALVRRSLSEHARVDPADWRFAPGEQGRPEVVEPADGPALRFSLSHTRGMSACAVTVKDDIGIDVERATRKVDSERLARRVLSPDEVDRLSRLMPGPRQVAFLRHWTLREAWVKAQGEGMLRVPRDAVSFRVGGRAGEEIEAKIRPGRPVEPGVWHFFLRELEGSHLCAVALHGEGASAVTLSVGRGAPF